MADHPDYRLLVEKRSWVLRKIVRLRDTCVALKRDEDPVSNNNYQKVRNLPRQDILDLERKFAQCHELVTAYQLQNDFFDSNECNAVFDEADEGIDAILSTIDWLTPTWVVSEASPYVSANSLENQLPLKASSGLKLKRIELPVFDGQIAQFVGFLQSFDALVHNQDKLSDLEKFLYLKSSLKGEPLDCIAYLPSAEESYGAARKILSNRYSNKKLIISVHLASLRSLPSLVKQDAASVRSFVAGVRQIWCALEGMGVSKSQLADAMLSELLFLKLDTDTSRALQRKESVNEIVPFEDYLTSLEKICAQLEAVILAEESSMTSKAPKIQPPIHKPNGNYSSKFQPPPKVQTMLTTNEKKKCIFCTQLHESIFHCEVLGGLSPKERYDSCKTKDLCINCLGSGHRATECSSKMNCRVCGKRHHSLLHFDRDPSPGVNSVNSATAVVSGQGAVHSGVSYLPTILVNVVGSGGTPFLARALLDSGSQINIVSRELIQKLKLPSARSVVSISGLNSSAGAISESSATFQICSLNGDDSFTLTAQVLPKIITTPSANSRQVNPLLPFTDNLILADPSFYKSSKVDILLGVELYPRIVRPALVSPKLPDLPCLMNTVFGWVVCGGARTDSTPPSVVSVAVLDDSLLERFWEVESVPHVPIWHPDDKLAESVFESTIVQREDGHLQVGLPFSGPAPVLGSSFSRAAANFLSLERRFLKNPSLKEAYSSQIQNYIDLGQLEVCNNPTQSENHYYIPHHAVYKASDLEKINPRIVFNASAPSSNGLSLNDLLLTGPKLQKDLFSVLLNFRTFQYPLTADIQQMYRQIFVQPSDRDFQRILWRFDPSAPLASYKLAVVTFGVKSSPFLAIRSLHYIADSIAVSQPKLAQLIRTCFYMDDLCAGADSPQEVQTLKSDLTTLFASYGFNLHKWNLSTDIEFSGDDSIKVLGIRWSPSTDMFSFSSCLSSHDSLTKRFVLSQIMRIFDPLGFLAPFILIAKLIMQRIWQAGLDWDDPLPDELACEWNNFVHSSSSLEQLSLPRFVFPTSCHFELHGFADASKNAYGAVVYLRAIFSDGRVSIALLASKSRLASIGSSTVLTIPRMELCAAMLVSELITIVLSSITISVGGIYAWSDSTITLSRICNPNVKLPTFEANRIAQILSSPSKPIWCYVATRDNPADLVSRGVLAAVLVQSQLWWSGPEWLREAGQEFPSFRALPHSEATNLVLTELSPTSSESKGWFNEFLNKHSSFLFIQSVLVYVFRFLKILPKLEPPSSFSISMAEYEFVTYKMVLWVQREVFSSIISALRSNCPKQVPKSIRKLAPFLDAEGFLRVGGRLHYSGLALEAKHPVLLPSNHRFTELIIQYYHKVLLHPGIGTLVAHLARQFWILACRKSVRKYTSSCLNCFRVDPVAATPLMAPLPESRVSPDPPFLVTGVDMAGPFSIINRLRRNVVGKAYLCLFVCFSTKAVHLEVVSELSAESFLAALRRFLSRRGNCQTLYSDNGTNFIGACRILKTIVRSAEFKSKLNWGFNPPYSPSMGGLWEKGIHSAKTILYRILGNRSLTFEELSTMFAQVEAMLNSRPLYPVSSDPNDPLPLTPAHFLNVKPPLTLFTPELTSQHMDVLPRWKRLQAYFVTIWDLWSHEYLKTLQSRHKWYDPASVFKIDDIVLIIEPSSPLHWKIARISKLLVGRDGQCRVVELVANNQVTRRHVSKICLLPINPSS